MPVHESKENKTGDSLDARSLVYARLSRQLLRYPDLAIEPVDTSGLSQREQAFAKALEITTLTRWRTLEAVVSSRLKRPWQDLEPKLRAALLGGAAQLLFMDRIPDHAAVAETVSWAKRSIRQGAGGMVNGVLRAITRLRKETLPAEDPRAREWWEHRDIIPLETGEALLLDEPVFSDDRLTRVGEQASLGNELLLGWVGARGWACAQERASHCLARPPIFIHEPGSPSRPWEGSHAELVELLESVPDARVQDPGSARAIMSTSELEPRTIVDFCAGRGTKTRQLAELHPDAEIFATDVNDARLEDLRRTFEGHPRVHAVEPAGLRDVIGQVDLLVLDVPCSNTGVLPRRPQARYRIDDERRASLARLQKEIVSETVNLLAPGAHLLYITCSIEPGENETIARWIEKRYEVEVLTCRQLEPTGHPGGAREAYADGGFHALFAGRGSEEEPSEGSEPVPEDTGLDATDTLH